MAGQIASAIKNRDPEEGRCVVVGLGVDFGGMVRAPEHIGGENRYGLGDGEAGREAWLDLVEGVVGCLG